MPFDNPSNARRPPVVVSTPTEGGGLAATPLPVDQAIALPPTKILIGAPAVGNLPQNALPGQSFIFQSNPSTIYFFCPDNLYRAVPMLPVS